MKGLFEPATSYVRDQDVNKETNKIQITEQNFQKFPGLPEFPFYFGKTALQSNGSY